MKKIFLAMMVAVLTLALILCGCDSENGEAAADGNNAANSGADTGSDGSAAGEGEFNYSAYLDENGYFEGVKAGDYVTLPEYKGITVPEEVLKANQDRLNTEVSAFLANSGSDYEKIYDRAVEDGDTLNIDYVGSIDGVEFQGGSTGGRGTVVTIGVTQYIDDFLQQLIGHKPGENFDIEVTFPENYGNEELNGKDAIFNITINYIAGKEIPPVLNDEFAAKYGFTSAQELLKSIEEFVVDQQKSEYFNQLVASAECKDFPEEIIQHLNESVIAEFEFYASYYGTDVQTLLEANGFDSTDDLIEQSKESILVALHDYFVIQAIAEAEGITVSDETVLAKAEQGQVETYGMPYMKQYYLAEAVRDFIFENAA